MPKSEKQQRREYSLTPLFLLWLSLRLTFRIFGRNRRRILFNRLGWTSLKVFRKQLFSRFPFIAKYDITQQFTEERLILNLSGELFVDVGAHVGYMSLIARRKFSRIIAIEPHPTNFTTLTKKIQKANATNIQPLQLAVSDTSQSKMPLYIGNTTGTHSLRRNFAGGNQGVSGVWSALISEETRAKKGDSVYVATITLGDLLDLEPFIDLVKVDVEGAEWAVLEGAEPIVEKVNAWIVEVHFRNKTEMVQSKQRIEGWLEDRGYSTLWIDYKRIFGWK